MKAEELRIGNYVKIDEGIGKVVSLMSNTFCNECANDDYNITIEMEDGTFREEEESKVEGIPLTEEVLLTCGFEYINSDNKMCGMLSPDDGQSLYEVIVVTSDRRFLVVINTEVEHLVGLLGVTHWMPIPSFDEILEANRDVLERIKEKGD